MVKLFDALNDIDIPSEDWRKKGRERLNALAIPQGSLGAMTNLCENLVAITCNMTPTFPKKEIFVMAGDHGVVAEGVSLFPKEVTVEMVGNFIKGGAGINAFAKNAGAKVNVVDIGVDGKLDEIYAEGSYINRKVAYGTDNMVKGPAMSRENAISALEVGINLVVDAHKSGVSLVATGDMGIGNTTPSTAIFSALSGLTPSEITGRGTGLDEAAVSRKSKVIETALAVNNVDGSDGLDVLSKVGGYDIAGIAGVILGAAYCKIPVIVDGFISTAGALIANALCPKVNGYMIAAHASNEQAHQKMLDYLDISPLLRLDLRLGEGTGAALSMPLVDAAAIMLSDMLTFEEAAVTSSEG